MTRFEQKPTPALYGAIALTTTLVAVADLLTPFGVAVWIIYLIPIILTLFVWRPSVPIYVGTITTILMVIGLLASPSGGNVFYGRLNRGFGILTVWIVSGVAYEFIRFKLNVRKDEWLQLGQMRLSEAVRGEQSLERIGEKVLAFLAGYLEAHAGAFFVEDHGAFRRVAGYAIAPDSAVPERLGPGEGLLVQAVKDRRVLFLNHVPEGYFQVRSALGRGTPRHLLIAPLTADGVVNSVLELALIHPAFASDRELLERTADAIGIAVRMAQDRMRLKELLEETQRQGEELQAQSEELRVSNEELAEQGRALNESQTRLEQQQAELEQTNSHLQDQTRILEAQKAELTRAKSELEGQKKQLELASRYKSDFLANMSHELRTPLNSSLILAKLLSENRDGNLTPEQVKYAETIESAGNDLLGLITEILDLSKIEAGRMDVHPEVVPVRRILENLARMFEPLAAGKHLSYRWTIGAGTPESLETDPQRLEQVLKNLLSNAVKFTERGEVRLEVSQGKPGELEFRVTDTGIGIAPNQQEIIFEPFRQADGTTNRRYGGTGLGLSISRELISLLGGKIELASKVGQGSTFAVFLPVAYTPGTRSPTTAPMAAVTGSDSAATAPTIAEGPTISRTTADSTAANPFPRMRDDRERLTGNSRVILVVEDDEPFTRILADLAHELGFQCLIASTAEEGWTMAVQFCPSAVLLDVGLPDNSGLSVLDRLKGDSRTRHIPVHVISAGDHAQAALAMGAVGYMLKPVRREQLVHAFEQLETRLTQRLRKVLVVEDDEVQLESLRSLLGSREVETVGAHNAAECLELLKASTVDCMVLDLNLPDASGLSLLETLSREERYSFPPVIVYTGRELAPQEEQRLRKYSKSIIIKGAKSPERLLDEVTLFLHQVVSELSAEQQKLLQKARGRDAAIEGKRILVVEDDVRNVFAISSILEPRGVKVQIARNGREALEVLERSLKDPPGPDLVLMDVMMPEMDGLTATREIRRRTEWKKLPIIALTAKAMKSDQEQCLAAGANDYMSKPLDVEKLLSLVRVWMPR